ncbi:MAG: hypothetical protein U9O50_08920 [Acidobacteriota bacterium]|nr:hypothetical protein [Acidobacteriota bacterium]
MKKSVTFLTVLFLFMTTLNAKQSVELFGYFETQIMGAKVKNDFFQMYTNKLRVDLKASLSKNITFAANFDYITYHGKTEWNLLDFLSPSIASKVPPGMESFYILPFSNRSFLDNAYIKLAFRYFDLTVGKQQISIGTGYVWNPLDVFNIKDILDPTYEQPGHNAIRLDVPVGPAYTFTALYSPEDLWKNSAKLIQFKGRISHFDYYLVAIERIWRFHDYTQFHMQEMNFLEVPERRRLFGASLAGEILGLGIWAEYGYNKMEVSKDFYELVVGADYTFDFQTYVMLEYYRNTLGKADYKEYNLCDWMRLFTAEQKALSQDQIYILIQHPATDLMSVGLSTICSLSDISVALVPTMNYSLSENVEIMAYLNFNFGREGKVFAKNMGNGGLLRMRVYF